MMDKRVADRARDLCAKANNYENCAECSEAEGEEEDCSDNSAEIGEFELHASILIVEELVGRNDEVGILFGRIKEMCSIY